MAATSRVKTSRLSSRKFESSVSCSPRSSIDLFMKPASCFHTWSTLRSLRLQNEKYPQRIGTRTYTELLDRKFVEPIGKGKTLNNSFRDYPETSLDGHGGFVVLVNVASFCIVERHPKSTASDGQECKL